MSRTIEHGSINQRVRCRVFDLNGEPYEGLDYDAPGIAVFFQRIGSTATSISLVLGTGLNDDHTDGKWNEIGDGWYQLDSPDGAFASGIDSPLFYGSATGYTFIFESIMLVTSQPYPANFASLGINASGHVSRVTLVDTTTTNTDMRGTDSAYTGTPPTAAAIVDEWETQSQADPTGFHVNVKEANGTSVSGPDDFKATGYSTHSAADVRVEMDSNSTQLAAIVEDTGTTLPSTLTSIAGSITTIGTNVSTLLTRIPAALFSGITSLAQWLGAGFGKQTADSTARTEIRATGAGSGTFDETTDSMEALRDRGDAAWTTGSGGGGTGTGARTVTVTVDNGTDPLESARVRLTKGAETYIASTDVSGQIEFSIDDGTWTVAITLYGHTFTPTTLVVDGDETPTYSMTAATITPPTSPDAITAVYHLTDSDLADDDGVAVYYRMITPPTGSGIGFQQAWESVTSDANGDVSIPVIPGAEYELAIGGTGSDYCKFRTTIDGAATNGYLIAPNSTYQVSE